jgi:hypothetical protein
MDKEEVEKWKKVRKMLKEGKSQREIEKSMGINHKYVSGFAEGYNYAENCETEEERALQSTENSIPVILEGKLSGYEWIKVPSEIVHIFRGSKKRKYYKLSLAEQAHYAVTGHLPKPSIPFFKNVVIDSVQDRDAWVLEVDGKKVIFFDEQPCISEGVKEVQIAASEVSCFDQASGLKKFEYPLGNEITEREPAQQILENPSLEKAIDEIAPYFYGNSNVKKLILYACCGYDSEDPRSIIPFMFYGQSGGGKSYLAEGLDSSLGAYIFKSDSLRKTVGGMYEKDEKKVIRLPDRQFIVFDELDKWNTVEMNLTLPLVGEKAFAVEYGRAIERYVKAMPIFLVLPEWEEVILAGKRSSPYKLQVFRQIQRRCIHLKLEDVKESDVIKKIAKDTMEKREISTDNLRSIISRAKNLTLNYDPYDEWVADFVSNFSIQGANYRPELTRLVIKLASGCARARGMKSVGIHDFEEVGNILLEHAWPCGVRDIGKMGEEVDKKRELGYFGDDYQ